jgi:hypothetical protein
MKVLLASAFAAIFSTAAMATTVSSVDIEGKDVLVTSGGRTYVFDLGQTCLKQPLKAGNTTFELTRGSDGRRVFIEGYETRINCNGKTGGGGTTQTAGKDTGKTAKEIANEVYGDGMADNVGTVVTTAVAATGEGQEAGDEVAAEGLTQSDMTEGATDTPPMP